MLVGRFYSNQVVRVSMSKPLKCISNSSAKEDSSLNISISQGRNQTRAFGWGLHTPSETTSPHSWQHKLPQGRDGICTKESLTPSDRMVHFYEGSDNFALNNY